ncbi:hypothetical protein GW932_05325 [archaeon]|nr:hypothetical protein [archaeon]
MDTGLDYKILNKQELKKLKYQLRSLVYRAVKQYKKSGNIMKSEIADKYNIDLAAIIERLKPFPTDPDMQIDHIEPLSSFNLSNPKVIKYALGYWNFQWLGSSENKSKGKFPPIY